MLIELLNQHYKQVLSAIEPTSRKDIMHNTCSLAIANCKSLAGAIKHNRNRKDLDYVNPDGEIFTYENQIIKNLSLAEVHRHERQQIAALKQIIKDKTGRASQVKKFYLDGLIILGRDVFNSLDSNQKIQLQKKVVEFIDHEFQKNLNTNIQHVSFHYDEGNKNEHGEWVINPHVHFTVENVNRDTGKSINRTITRVQLKNLQSSLADTLNEFGFIRGRDYSANNEQAPKQVYWKDYKRQKEQITKDKLIEIIESKKEFETKTSDKIVAQTLEIQHLQQTIIQQNIAINNQNLAQKKQIDNLQKEITQLKQDKINLENTYKQERKELINSGIASQKDHMKLKSIHKSELEEKDRNLVELTKSFKKALESITHLTDEVSHLKKSNNRLETQKTALQSQLLDLQALKKLEIEKEEQKLREKSNVLNSNDSVLAYYSKINPELVEKVRKNGYIEVPGVNGGISQLTDNNPEHLAELLGKSTGYCILKKQTYQNNQNNGFSR